MEIDDNGKVVMNKAEKELFVKTVKAFIRTKQFNRKSILSSYMLASQEFAGAYRKKYGESKVFPLLRASMTLKQLFANVLEKKGIEFNRKALFHFEVERDKRKEQGTGNQDDAGVIVSKITKKVMARGASR